jgi:P-type Ca2+ transporter type 2C
MDLTAKPQGLARVEAAARLQRYGPNSLTAKPPVSLWLRFLRQFRSPLIYVLLAAWAVDTIIWISEGSKGTPVESVAITIILLLNAGLGVYQESKSEASLAALREMSAPLVWVLRDGRLWHVPGRELVPGDVVRIEAGDRVPADGNLIEGEGTMVDESVLTGESLPVEKTLADEVFSGTLLVRGTSYLEVTRTGEQSTMGRLAVMIGGIHADATPLERRLDEFGGQIARVVLALVVLMALGGVLVNGIGRLSHVFLFSVALAVAAIPEGLPAALTLTLALGVERMAKRKAVVRRLSAVESLGSVTVIATDKTGTLTENRMFVKDLDSPDPARALHAMALANDAEEGAAVGDPLELALLDYVHQRGIELSRLRSDYPRHTNRPFDSSSRFMRVTVIEGDGSRSYVKGAPEVILRRSLLSAEERSMWEEKAGAYAREGYRLLALGHRAGEGEQEILFLGLVLLWDPPRAEVRDAIQRAHAAGIRVVMITGDHPATAMAVAHEVGISGGRVLTGIEIEAMAPEALREAVRETNIFARVVPEDKLRLVEALKQNGEIVAMTGDGVNDAPALKRADVGVAMGKRGSDVAREVADLVLMDDNFATIIAAIEEGRNIYENIQKFIRFLFSSNLAEISIVLFGAFGSVLIGLHDETGAIMLPLTAVQLLWVNIITDGAPALALGLDRDPAVMREAPRDPQSSLLDQASLRFIVVAGCTLAAVGGVLLLAMPQLGFTATQTRTAIFLHITIGQLSYVYPARRNFASGGPPRFNGALHLAVALGIGLQFLIVFVPGLRLLTGGEPPTPALIMLVTISVLLAWAVAEAYARLTTGKSKSAAADS